MNEHDWLLALDPAAMIDFLHTRVYDRKLRLLACAFVRQRWELLRYPTPREAVEMGERYALGAARRREIEAMRQQAQQSAAEAPEFERHAYQAAAATLLPHAIEAVRTASASLRAQFIAEEANAAMSREDELRIIVEAGRLVDRQQGQVVLEVFGNVFCPPVVEPAWLRWSDGAVAKMARLIDQERRWEELPYLADALTDAGCTEEALVRHLREPGAHVRGCWALDAVLGRE